MAHAPCRGAEMPGTPGPAFTAEEEAGGCEGGAGSGGHDSHVSAWRLAAAPLVVGVGVRVFVVVCFQVLHGNFLFLDDQGDDGIGWFLAQSWHMHMFPSPAAVAVTNSYLYYVLVAAVYFVFGRHWLLIKLIAALLSALSVPAATAIGVSLSGRRLGIRAAWLAALYPSAVFWGATGLKDGPLATLALAMAAIALRPLTMRRLACAVALLVVAFLARPVEGVIGLAMLAVPAARLAWSRWPVLDHIDRIWPRLLVLLVGIPAASVVSFSLADRYLPTLNSSLAGQPALSLANGPVAISFLPSPFALVHALVDPIRWFGPPTDSAYGALVPGAFVWTLMLPAVALGCWRLLRQGPWAIRGVLVSVLAYLYMYTCVFQNQGFTRQRYTVEMLLLVAGLYAFEQVPRAAIACTAICACVIAPTQLVISGVLPLQGLVPLVAALGALWLAASSNARAYLRHRRQERAGPQHALSGARTSGGHGR
jgi:hypothetical protein